MSGSLGVHDADLASFDTVNASLGSDTPTSFDLGTNRQREINLNADVSYAVTDRVNVAAGIEWRDEQFGAGLGDPASWAVGPLHEQGFFAGAHGFPGYGPLAVGEWSRGNFAAYGDVEVSGGRRRRLDARRGRSGPSASRISARRRTASCPDERASCAAA